MENSVQFKLTFHFKRKILVSEYRKCNNSIINDEISVSKINYSNKKKKEEKNLPFKYNFLINAVNDLLLSISKKKKLQRLHFN